MCLYSLIEVFEEVRAKDNVVIQENKIVSRGALCRQVVRLAEAVVGREGHDDGFWVDPPGRFQRIID
jgi:hypothetical protein